jgi:hypothetical protein
MYGNIRPPHHTAIDIADALVTQTDSQDGNPAPEITDDVIGDAGFEGGTGAGRDDDMTRCHSFYPLQGDAVIAHGDRLPSQLTQILYQVIGKRVVVINDQNHVIASTATSGDRVRA